MSDITEIGTAKAEVCRDTNCSSHNQVNGDHALHRAVILIFSTCQEIIKNVKGKSPISNIPNTRKGVLSGYSNSEKWVEKNEAQPNIF